MQGRLTMWSVVLTKWLVGAAPRARGTGFYVLLKDGMDEERYTTIRILAK